MRMRSRCCRTWAAMSFREAWRGNLPLTYHVGPGPAKAHLHLKFNWDRKPLYDVIVRIPGSEYPDEWVIRGNHHDAWVNGADDPVSGASAEMEEARALAELLKARLEAGADHYLLLLGRRRTWPVGINGVGRDACRGTEATRGRLYQFRWQRAGLVSRRRVRTRSRTSSTA